MARGDEDFNRNINFLLKSMQEFVTNIKTYANPDYSKVYNEMKKSANASGLAEKDFLKQLKNSIPKLGMTVSPEIVKVLQNFEKGLVENNHKISDPKNFLKVMDELFIRIKTMPINLNTKENLSIISKAIAKGNRDYASTGFGKYQNDFYKKATDKQILELSNIRKQIKDGVSLKNDNNTKGVITGLLAGTAGAVGDVLMENAGFGQLPGKFMNMFNAGRELYGALKKNQGDAEVERNAFLLQSAKISQASYTEIKERNDKNSKAIEEGEGTQGELKASLSSALQDALKNSGFGKTKQASMLGKLDTGNFGQKEINDILLGWKKQLGPNITNEQKEQLNSFNAAMNNGIADLKEIDGWLADVKNRYKEDLDKQAESLSNVIASKKLEDSLLEKEIQVEFAAIEKRLKGFEKTNGKEATESLKQQLQREKLSEIREKHGVADTESFGIYNNHKEELRNIERKKGTAEADIDNNINSKYGDVLKDTEEEQARKDKLSPIFKDDSLVYKTVPRKINPVTFNNIKYPVKTVATPQKAKRVPKITNKNSSNTPVIGPQPLSNATTNPIQNSNTPQQNPNQASQIPSSNKQTPAANRSSFPVIEKNTEYFKKLYEFMVKIYGNDGEKLAELFADKYAEKTINVHVTNFPTGGGGSNGPTTTPPDNP